MKQDQGGELSPVSEEDTIEIEEIFDFGVCNGQNDKQHLPRELMTFSVK